jgi:hypothetical protein
MPQVQLRTTDSPTQLYGAFDKRNKQLDLAKKMAEAKRQKEAREKGLDATAALIDDKKEDNQRMSDEEMKVINDRKRFEELLNSEAATVNYSIGNGNYKTSSQEEEEINAYHRGVDRIMEGDPAKEAPFYDIVNIHTGNALGKEGASRMLPWLNTNQKDYLVIITDPREKSLDLRSTIKGISANFPPNELSKLIVINADTPSENKRYLKKNDISNVNVYCDEKREWMREYTVLGENRWSMSVLILADKRVERLVRDVDLELAVPTIQNAIQSLKR